MNRTLIIGLLFLASVPSFAQQSLKNIRKKSWQSFVYRISADTAEKYLDKGMRSPQPYLSQQPYLIGKADSLVLNKLPIGNYLVMTIDDNKLAARVYCQSALQVETINDQRKVQLEVRDSAGHYLDRASVWVNGRPAGYDVATKSYRVHDKKPEEALVKIAFGNDTLFQTLNSRSDVYKGSWSQWWRNFSYSRIGRYVTWPVRSVRYMITHPAYLWFHKRNRVRSRNNGYMVFNKPKYQPLDTLKFKAYLVNKKGKQYKSALDVSMEYYKVQQVKIDLGSLKPETPGAFIHEFVLGDSLDSDRQYSIVFRNKKGEIIFQRAFQIEDYLLDEMKSNSLRSEKDTYFRNDTLVFMANAKDANGLSVMDGRVTLYVLARNIIKFYKDEDFIPDTLWKQEKTLDVSAETKFEIPASAFPAADLSLDVQAEFRNSNNELAQQRVAVTFMHQAKVITVKQQGNEVVAELIENGKPVTGKGWLKKTYIDHAAPIAFPFKEKVDAYTESYFFSVLDDAGKQIAFADWRPDSYHPSFRLLQVKDTAGFALHNPAMIPIHYTVFYGRRVIARGADSTESVSWKDHLQPSKAYRVSWQYIWAGSEQTSGESVMVLDKLLNTSISGASTIYPGQTDTITVSVKDYKGRAAADVNLTAVSYNNQFAGATVPDPPYLKKYKRKRAIFRDRYDSDNVDYSRNFDLGSYAAWINQFHLDSMVYYKFLFPKDSFYAGKSLISSFNPQVAIHVVKQGVRQEVHMLYLNRELVYYNGVTDKSNYAFTVLPGYTKIGIRLADQFIEIDSLYMQPHYKTDMSFDLDHLPRNAVVEKRPAYYTLDERQTLEYSIWQLDYDQVSANSYVWQDDRLVYIRGEQQSNYQWNEYSLLQGLFYKRHLIGPFVVNDSLQFFKPGAFDIKFAFESNYQYRLTPKMARLERRSLFPSYRKKQNLPFVYDPQWIIGDTVMAPPKIEYPAPVYRPVLISNDYQYTSTFETGKLLLQMPPDSLFAYMVLWNKRDSVPPRIKSYNLWEMKNIPPGVYDLVLVTNSYSYLQLQDIVITAGGTTCIHVRPGYSSMNAHVAQIFDGYKESTMRVESVFGPGYLKLDNVKINAAQLSLPTGGATIFGRVTDDKGKDGIPSVTIHVKGYSQGFVTASDGTFTIRNIAAGTYIIIASYIGYETQEVQVMASEGVSVPVSLTLTAMEQHLEDVVVVGYGTARRKSFSESITTISGKTIGDMVTGPANGLASNASIRLRGFSSSSLYVLNGVAMDKLPDGFDMSKAMVNYLNDASATELYGERAAGGVVVITTADGMPKEMRDKFRDYAFWQPNLFTDDDGNVKFTVTYPDNITGWQTYVLGMDKKRRITKATTAVKSFKPLIAQLSTPPFLVEGDSATLIGKVTNYTKEAYSGATYFVIPGQKWDPPGRSFAANAATIEELPVVAGMDTLSVQYSVATTAGYRDGELRKIPVVKSGIAETIGQFWILPKDTSISFTPDPAAGTITLHIQNNTLDVFLDEIEKLKKYPYYCLEQTASKLTGLIMEKKIRAALKQDFRGEKEMQRLLGKLQKAQLYGGGWSWWEGGRENLAVTNYITRALLLLRDQPLVETNVRNALLYLHRRLDRLPRSEMIPTLFTLSEAGHEMDYQPYLNRLVFDSLSVHQQWEVVRIKQRQKIDYAKELSQLMNKKHQGMLGSVYWGDDSFYWDRNRMATTVLAYTTLQVEGKHETECSQIVQFFLEQRNKGKWMNTVESASIVSAVLPSLLKENDRFAEKASVRIGEGSTAPITSFPFTAKLSSINNPLTISKSGGGLIYVSAYQEVFRNDPVPVTDKFAIRTWFERSGSNTASLKAGEKVTMKISLNVFKDAEYVQVEIPIPAGCTYGDKKQAWNMHKEYLKNRAIFFIEDLRTGNYTYEIELEPRYTGTFTMNPAKAELMYFPVFFGRNAIKKVAIKK